MNYLRSSLSLKSLSSFSDSILPFSNSPFAFPKVLASSGIFFAPKIKTPMTTTAIITFSYAISGLNAADQDLSVAIFLACFSETAMPMRYNTIMWPATNHMVTPLPSGVMAAPKMTIAIMAYRMLFLQNFGSINPDAVSAYIISGNWNDIPNARMNWSTNVMKSIMFRNVTKSADWPYLYRKSRMYGVTKRYENRPPIAKRTIAGIVMFLIIWISFLCNAGAKNPTNSLTMIGIANTRKGLKRICVQIHFQVSACIKLKRRNI